MNDVLIRIKQGMEDFSANHQEIAKYILENPDCLETCTARELAEKTYSVPSSIISFSKKIGYSGFQEMKFNYGNSPFDCDNKERDFLRPFQLVNKLLNTKVYNDTVNILINANRIYILAFQMSQVTALDFYLKVHKVDPTLVTNGIESTLSEFCTHELSIGCFEKNILTFKEIPTDSRNALLYLMDRLFKDMIKQNYDDALEKIKKSSLFFSNI